MYIKTYYLFTIKLELIKSVSEDHLMGLSSVLELGGSLKLEEVGSSAVVLYDSWSKTVTSEFPFCV